MKRQVFSLFIIAFAAEISASWFSWQAAPTDTVRVWYEGNFWAYEVVRMIPWLVIFAILVAAYLLWTRKN